MSDWRQVCVLCAARGVDRRLETGHVCKMCEQRLLDDLTAITDLAAAAAAYLTPGSAPGGFGSGVFGSRPPLNVTALDPELTQVPGRDMTVLECTEAWTRLTLELRGMSSYGPWSLNCVARLSQSAPQSWENGLTKDPGEAATSRGVTNHREG